MSQSDREVSKPGKYGVKEGEGSDLSLSGSQVSLVSRPRSVMGKASVRALSVLGPRVRRPMSAVPSMSFLEIPRDKRRPYSADSQPVLSSYQQKRNKLSSCSISIDPIGFNNHDIETDGDMEFSSSTLMSSHMSDHEGAWMELEMRGLYLGHSDPAQHSCSTDNGSDLFCCSDASEEPTRSEKSLGERIQAMARDHVHSSSKQNEFPNELNSNGVQSSLEKYICMDDPKKMSTKELHLRMVESGLIPASLPYISVYGHENIDKINSQNISQQDLVLNVRSHQNDDDLQRKTSDDRLSNDTAGIETNSRGIWNQPNEFFQSLNKSACAIDQISFPKEHDVDSLEGESGCCHSGNEVPSNEKNGLNDMQVHSEQENVNDLWTNTDVVPVRFQQWMMDGEKNHISELNVSSTFATYYGVRHSNLLNENKQSPDCTIEEVSTDSESYKLSHMLDYNQGKALEVSDSGLHCKVSYSESNSSGPNDDHSFKKEVENVVERMGPHDDQRECVAVTKQHMVPAFFQHNNSITDAIHEKKSTEIAFPDPSKYASGITCTSEKFGSKDACVRRRPLGFEANLNKPKLPSISKGGSGNNRSKSPNAIVKRNQDKNSHFGQKRRNASKVDGSIRRCGIGSPISRNVSSPKEECLPEETQPELLSWMAMCSEESKDKSTPSELLFERQSAVSPTHEKNEGDSPYNEIMTLLRVLEDKEDESSLLKILNKRSEMKLQSASTEENAIQEHNPSSSQDENSSSPGSCSTFYQNDRPPTASSNTILNSPKVVWPEEKPLENCDANINQLKLVETTCVMNNAPVAQHFVQGELKNLLTFLDAVDQSCSTALQPKHSSKPINSPEIVDSHNLEELLLMGRSDLAQEIVSLRLALEDREATINLLRTALREQKDNQARQIAAHAKEIESRISQVKKECEAIIKRHQKFIDQLIADKASLSERCESLVQEAKESEEKHTKSLSHLEQTHKVEMQRIKDITAATEKLKRERWVENKTQKIKELTVRGLEPELTRLTAQHEQEMSALRTLHAQELEQMELRAARRSSQQMETLREQLVQEKEEALARERDMLRQRMEKQQLLFEEEGAEQRRRLVAEVRREQDRLATLEARLQAQLEDRKRNLEREAELDRERVRRDYADKLSEMHRKQQNEMLQMREALKAEKETWIETYQQQQKQAFAQTTNDIRDQLKRERDREIEVVIERLESEATISREEREKAAENRLRRVREQLTSELKDVESALNALKEKHVELRAQVQEKEDKLVSSEALNRCLQTQLKETQKIADQLSAERADLKKALRGEINNEIENLKQQLSDQNSKHQQQVQNLLEQAERERQTHQQELQQLYDRVKLAIAKKEEVVKVAKAKQKAAEEQNSHLQALLDHRRKESLLS